MIEPNSDIGDRFALAPTATDADDDFDETRSVCIGKSDVRPMKHKRIADGIILPLFPVQMKNDDVKIQIEKAQLNRCSFLPERSRYLIAFVYL